MIWILQAEICLPFPHYFLGKISTWFVWSIFKQSDPYFFLKNMWSWSWSFNTNIFLSKKYVIKKYVCVETSASIEQKDRCVFSLLLQTKEQYVIVKLDYTGIEWEEIFLALTSFLIYWHAATKSTNRCMDWIVKCNRLTSQGVATKGHLR